MKRLINWSSRMTRVIVAATVFLLLGSVLPPLYKNQARPLPLNLNFTVTTEPATGPALNILRALHHEACRSPRRPGLRIGAGSALLLYRGPGDHARARHHHLRY